jgi:hypothetical protein
MAYLHCHNCDWSQDDFWNWKWTYKFWKFRPFGYNPVSLIFDDISDYWKPRRIGMDSWWIEEIKIRHKNGEVHSWVMLIWQIKRHIKRIFTMKVWTYKKWEKVRKTWVCPECKSNKWDID